MSPEPIFPQQPSHISLFFLFFVQNSRKAAKSHDREIGSARRDGGEHVTVCVYTGKKKNITLGMMEGKSRPKTKFRMSLGL